jgi:hypothetical protein
MGKCVQFNKQTTIVKVKVKTPCRKAVRRRCPISKKKIPACIAVMCGDIFQSCNDSTQTYFTALEMYRQAYVRITNDSPCLMRVALELGSREVDQQIAQGQQISFAVPHFRNLNVTCCGDSNAVCSGRYEIRLYQ